jgi:hypothetical protein
MQKNPLQKRKEVLATLMNGNEKPFYKTRR